MSSGHSSRAFLSPTEEKVALFPSPQPTGYPVAAGAPLPPPSFPENEGGQLSRCRGRCRRFGYFIAAAFLLWLAARFIVRPGHFPCGISVAHYGGHHHQSNPPGEINSCVDSADWSEFDPGEGHAPFKFDVWRRAELSLPSSADDIFLFSGGFNALGLLDVVEVPDREDIGVEVIVGFGKGSPLFESTKVCTFHRQNDGHGVGILTPTSKTHDEDVLFFNIIVSLPKGEDVTAISHFETQLPAFHHVISELPTHTFGSFSLHTLDGPIFVQSIVGDNISIRSTNGPIGGSFNTTHSLDIRTRNSPVDVSVNAFNDGNDRPTEVEIHTSNGFLWAKLALISTHEDQMGGTFHVDAQTSNLPLRLNITDQAPDSRLQLKAHTTNAPAHVQLHPSFEGSFEIRTSVLPATITPDEDVEDPASRGRTRRVDVKNVGRGARILHGDVAWIPQDEEVAPAGKVQVSTTHAPLVLLL